ncbi:MAG: glucose-6-phosphate isomerase, partial [Gammaproteobacteria bacterium]|nr:glucose-6-phosphate isomerase [Gammaproteobacteria bacterium]
MTSTPLPPLVTPEANPMWQALARHADRLRDIPLADLRRSPGRDTLLCHQAAGLMLDATRQRLDAEALAALVQLAEAAALPAWIEALTTGAEVNLTEGRAALHTALRRPAEASALLLDGRDVMPEILAVREQMRTLVERVHSGAFTGWTGRAITDVVNIGIGGSDLGPVMAVEALHDYRQPGLGVHFVSNVDGVQARDLQAQLDPETTLFILCSKSFTTQETRVNAEALRAWLHARGGDEAVRRQFVAVSTNQAAMDAFGIAPEARFTLWDWVGGRYSLWSAVGLSLAMAIGWENFAALLEGGGEMDRHFTSAPLARNLPVLMALLGVWNQNFLGCESHVVLPYDQRLHRLPAYLQQLDMESNGKRVTRDGQPVAWATGAVLWGEPGSNAQHSFYQLLHQGTRAAHVEFLAPAEGSGPAEQHVLALANMLAQAEALAGGYGTEAVREELTSKGLSG